MCGIGVPGVGMRGRQRCQRMITLPCAAGGNCQNTPGGYNERMRGSDSGGGCCPEPSPGTNARPGPPHELRARQAQSWAASCGAAPDPDYMLRPPSEPTATTSSKPMNLSRQTTSLRMMAGDAHRSRCPRTTGGTAAIHRNPTSLQPHRRATELPQLRTTLASYVVWESRHSSWLLRATIIFMK